MYDIELNSLKLDKSKWKLFPLGALAKEVSKRVDNPSISSFKRFVGLEHFVSGELKIKNWGATTNVTSSAKAFKTGDVLFARRNAYLRRASIVDFDGCCSGDAFVLRENHDHLIPGFMSFIVNSKELWDFANENAAGTMSKRVKWSDLENYKTLLPPKEQQAELMEMLNSVDCLIENELIVEKSLRSLSKSLFKQELFEYSSEYDNYFHNFKSRYDVKKLGNLIVEIQYGISESLNEEANCGIPVLRMNNLQDGKLDLTDLKYFTAENGELDKFILNKGDVLFNRTNSFDLVGKVSLFDEDGVYSFASYLIRILVKKNLLDPRFLNFYLNSSIGLAKIRKYRTPGVSQCNINAQNLKNIPIPLPPLQIQTELMDKIEELQKLEATLEKKIRSTRSLQKALINQVF